VKAITNVLTALVKIKKLNVQTVNAIAKIHVIHALTAAVLVKRAAGLN
jgi:hypothetical protein